MNNMLKISILGCGWLGLPLAKALLLKGYEVKGSTTSASKIPLLQASGIDPFIVQFSETSLEDHLLQFFNSDVLVIAVPPGRNDERRENYRLMATQLQGALKNSILKKLILISSTAVYGYQNKKVTETTIPHPDTESGKLLIEVEIKLANLPVKTCILRLGGLIGPDRHPGRFFSGKTDIPHGLAPVNIIHRDDAIGIILKLVETEQATGIYNGCCPDHPTRKDFYTLAAKPLKFTEPHFIAEKKEWKIVFGERVEKELKYQFRVADLMKWLIVNRDEL